MKNYILCLLCGGLMTASAAFAVSRVGGGTMSNHEEGLALLSVPPDFGQAAEVFSDDSVRFSGAAVAGGFGRGLPSRPAITIHLLRREFPDLSAVSDRGQFRDYFIRRGWRRTVSSDPCLESFAIETPDGTNVVTGWGKGQGLLLSGPANQSIAEAIPLTVDSIVLEAGACAWK